LLSAIAGLIFLSVLALSPAHACKALPWAYGYGARSSAEYARNLMKHATAIVLANVVSARRVEHAHGASSTADITVIERFKGAADIRQIHSIGFGTCEARTYTEGEERLFVLLSHPGDTRLYEVFAWESPRFPVEELLIELFKLKQPNTALERNAFAAALPLRQAGHHCEDQTRCHRTPLRELLVASEATMA
jgi:hypothetical protein